MSDFIILAFTLPSFFLEEPYRITKILREDKANIVHLRKPDSSLKEMENLIRLIPKDLHHRLKIHDHFSLIKKYELGGLHLNSRNNQIPIDKIALSRSCHRIDELKLVEKYDYVTLSPIFDSISKPGYHSGFNLKELKLIIKGKKVVALGGVTPSKLPELKEAGFYGAAMLGFFWKDIIDN